MAQIKYLVVGVDAQGTDGRDASKLATIIYVVGETGFQFALRIQDMKAVQAEIKAYLDALVPPVSTTV